MAHSHTGTGPNGTRADRHPADLVEAGNLLRTQPDLAPAPSATARAPVETERYAVIVIGAGQAGLSVSYHLARKGVGHIVLESAARIGDVWRNRWDSLRLFTPAKFDGLDGYRFPGDADTFPTKDQMADYLEAYARKFDLPVRLNARAERLYRVDGRFRVETEGGTIDADQVVVAAASYQKPRVPAFAGTVDEDIKQMHSHEYRNPGQIPDGPVLLVGGGNSGAEIAMDLVGTHTVTLSGREVGHIPFDISGFLGRKILVRLVVRGLFHRILTVKTPMGRKFRKKMHGHGMPLIRTRPGQLEAAGVRRVGRIAGFKDGKFVTAEGTEISCATVIWCTGYHPGFDWIDLPVLDESGLPRQQYGKSTAMDGLYFAGLHFQYAVSSTMVGGVGRDARRVADWISADRQR
ncbi:flavin-containing monooxygenase [Cucumibacter marinus]|uniref:flavin-containing monooxygenase n=1 Tax=Cucumibacter marinus TaxID=1121252 RepID=UPI0003F817B0|nr:NAD(P)-binding domain-containing protein [Cucumibacter marinus]